MNNLGQAFVQILPNLKSWGSQLRADIAKASNPALAEGEKKFSGFTTRVKNSLFSLKGAMAGAFGGLAIATVVKFGLQTAASLQQAQISFETLLGSATKAKNFLSGLKTFAASTPFELPGVIDAARQLLGAGAAAKEVIPTLTAYGDAAGALGLNQDQFGRAMLAVTQIMNRGKVQAGDLLQITEAGIPVYPLLAKALHKPVPELQKLGEQGKLLSKDVLPLLQKQMEKDYGGAMAKQSQTLAGLWSTLVDTFRLGLADALQPLVPILQTVMPHAMTVISTALKGLSAGFIYFINILQAVGIGFRTVDVGTDGFLGAMEHAGVGLAIVKRGLDAVVIGFKTADVGTDGFLGSLETLGMRIREVVDHGQDLLAFYREHTTLVQSATVSVIAMFTAFKLYQRAVLAINAVKIAMLALRASVIETTIAMLANPIGILVLAIVGLVAALVVVYKRNEAFRRTVNETWTAVKNAVGATITFLIPYFVQFVNFLKQVGTWTVWLWHNVIVPAFFAIKNAVGAAVTAITPYIKAWIDFIKLVGSVIVWMYQHEFKPVLDLIIISVRVFVALFQIAFGLATIVVKIFGSQIVWLYRNIISPYLHLIATVVSWLYTNGIKPNFVLIGQIISFTWAHVIKPAFDVLIWVVKNGIAPAFKAGVRAIAAQWDALVNIAKAPVRFVVNTVINGGIIDGYNQLAKLFNVHQVAHVKLPKGFARGGKFSTPTAIVGEGNTSRPEYVIPTDPKHRGRALSLYSELGTQLMEGGGVIGKLKSFGGDLFGLIAHPKDALTKLFNNLVSKAGNVGSSPFAQLLAHVPMKIVQDVVGFLTSKTSSAFLGGSGGGAGSGFAANRALGQQLAAARGWVGGQWDALNMLWNRESGWNNLARNPTSGAFGIPQSLPASKMGAAGAAGNPLAQINWGLKYIDDRYGSPAAAWAHELQVGWYDGGGHLPPGLSLAYNGTRRNELVAPTDDLETVMYRAVLRALRDGDVGGVDVTVDGDELKRIMKVTAKQEINASSTALKVGRR